MTQCGKSGQTMFAINRKCEVMSILTKVCPVLVYDDFLEGLESFVNMHEMQLIQCHSECKAYDLTLSWGTGIETAERT